MKEPITQIYLEKNRINLFYFFSHSIAPGQLKFADLTLPLPNAIQTKSASPLWEEHHYIINVDFLPNIRGLFRDCEHKAINSWKLASPMLKLLNGARSSWETLDNKAPVRLVQILSPSANKRLSKSGISPQSPRLKINEIQYHAFKTGFGVAVVDLQIINWPLSGDLLLESLHALCRFNKLAWFREVSDEKKEAANGENRSNLEQIGASFTMGALVRGLLGSADTKKSRRVFSHVFVSVSEKQAFNEMDGLLLYLSRHYTRDYLISDDIGESQLQADFINVHHCIANEGMASAVLINDDTPEFIINYYEMVVRSSHLPIVLLNFHAEQAIREYVSDTAIWLEKDSPVVLDKKKIKAQQITLMNFDSHFFYPVVSSMNAHNRLHRAMMAIKRLEEQHQIVATSTKIMDKLMRAHDEASALKAKQQRHEKICLLTAGGAFAVTYLTALSLINETIEVLNHEVLPAASSFHDLLTHHGGVIGLGIGLLTAIVAGVLTRNKCSEENEEKESKTLETAEILHLTHLLKKKVD